MYMYLQNVSNVSSYSLSLFLSLSHTHTHTHTHLPTQARILSIIGTDEFAEKFNVIRFYGAVTYSPGAEYKVILGKFARKSEALWECIPMQQPHTA